MKLFILQLILSCIAVVEAVDKPAGDFLRVSFRAGSVLDEIRIITKPRSGYVASEHKPTVWMNNGCDPVDADVWVEPPPSNSNTCCHKASLDGFKIWREKENFEVTGDVYVDYWRTNANKNQCTEVYEDNKDWRQIGLFGAGARFNSYMIQGRVSSGTKLFNGLIEFHNQDIKAVISTNGGYTIGGMSDGNTWDIYAKDNTLLTKHFDDSDEVFGRGYWNGAYDDVRDKMWRGFELGAASDKNWYKIDCDQRPVCPTPAPSPSPTKDPTPYPTSPPSPYPTKKPTPYPSPYPTHYPTKRPTPYPTPYPTKAPVFNPEPTTSAPTKSPTPNPTQAPTIAPTVDDSGNDDEGNDDDGDYGCRRRLEKVALRSLQEDAPTCTANKNSEWDFKGDFLAKKWGIQSPTFDYDSQKFALCYGVSDMVADNMARHVLYKNDCKTPVDAGVLSIIQDVYGDIHDPSGGFGDRTVELGLSINTDLIANSNIFSEPSNGVAQVEFCVRNQLFIEGTDIEINFLETIVTLTVDLRNCFEVKDIGVKPLDKTDESANEDFKLKGFLCDVDNLPLDTGVAPFTQGSVIRVCVTPDEKSRDSDLFMRYIEDFSFQLRGDPSVQQDAIVEKQSAPIGLTMIDCTPGSLICAFDTILIAKFFTESGFVDGSGSAVMQFGNSAVVSRRRQLQEGGDLLAPSEEAGPQSQFEMAAELVRPVDDFQASGAVPLMFARTILSLSVGALFFLSLV